MHVTLYSAVLIYTMCCVMYTMRLEKAKVVHVAAVERDRHYKLSAALKKELKHALNYKQ